MGAVPVGGLGAGVGAGPGLLAIGDVQAEHVLPKLPSPASPLWRSRRQIRSELEDFFGIDGDDPIELWAWVGAYDHVVLCQLWGPMTDLPPAIPRFTRELRQFWEDHGCPRMPPRPRDAHDALVDAKHNLVRYQLITGREMRF